MSDFEEILGSLKPFHYPHLNKISAPVVDALGLKGPPFQSLVEFIRSDNYISDVLARSVGCAVRDINLFTIGVRTSLPSELTHVRCDIREELESLGLAERIKLRRYMNMVKSDTPKTGGNNKAAYVALGTLALGVIVVFYASNSSPNGRVPAGAGMGNPQTDQNYFAANPDGSDDQKHEEPMDEQIRAEIMGINKKPDDANVIGTRMGAAGQDPLPLFSPDKTEIINNLWLGKLAELHNWKGPLPDLIVSAGPKFYNNLELDTPFSPDKIIQFDLVDGDGVDKNGSPLKNVTIDSLKKNDWQFMKETLQTIHERLGKGQTVFVACQQGKDRSAFVVYCYLMTRFNVPYKKAWWFVLKKRPIAALESNEGADFAGAIKEFSRHITGNDILGTGE